MGADRGETVPRPSSTAVTVRLFAAARDAYGARELQVQAGTVDAIRAEISAHSAEVARVLERCTVLVSGRRADGRDPVGPEDVVDVLPPFAGG